MTETWNPEQYEKFSDHRRRPFDDLTCRVGAVSPEVVVDLGCGSGAATLELAARWPGESRHQNRRGQLARRLLSPLTSPIPHPLSGWRR